MIITYINKNTKEYVYTPSYLVNKSLLLFGHYSHFNTLNTYFSLNLKVEI